LNKSNDRAADRVPAATHERPWRADPSTSEQWPLVERRKTQRRQHDRRHQAQHVELLGDASRLCTSREQQTARLVLRGMTNKQIAQTLGIAEDTVKKHLHSVYMKLGVRRRALLIVERASTIEPQRSTPPVE
jgi:DNA-binding NarL/FixJ family response regulator